MLRCYLMDPDTDVYQTEQPQISYSFDFTAEQSRAIQYPNLLGREGTLALQYWNKCASNPVSAIHFNFNTIISSNEMQLNGPVTPWSSLVHHLIGKELSRVQYRWRSHHRCLVRQYFIFRISLARFDFWPLILLLLIAREGAPDAV